jgi:uncharacterized lipoprotein YehR (DUF1307 family)
MARPKEPRTKAEALKLLKEIKADFKAIAGLILDAEARIKEMD